VKRVLVVHNNYRRNAPSGENAAFEQEVELLRGAGLDVATYERCNDEVSENDTRASLLTALNMRHSERTLRELRRVIAAHRPTIAHFHNTFPLLSASGYQACREAGVPVVQTLHNYRLICTASTLWRDGYPCHLCTPRNYGNAVLHSCYRSRVASLFVGRMLRRNWIEGVYTHSVDHYIALTDFAANLFAKAGIAREKISLKPNFLKVAPQPGSGEGGYVAYVGKLAVEKGLHTLLRAWTGLGHVPLKVVGTGPLERELREFASAQGLGVDFLGMCSRERSIEIMREAAFIVVPSEWYEGFPLVVAEAYACGTPIVASRIGGLPEMVREGVTGSLFEPKDPSSLAGAVDALWSRRGDLKPMRRACRAHFDSELTAGKNLSVLLDIYERTLAGYGHSGEKVPSRLVSETAS
jgi:glycosyltransferase involved in cell wall biosynthesis